MPSTSSVRLQELVLWYSTSTRCWGHLLSSHKLQTLSFSSVLLPALPELMMRHGWHDWSKDRKFEQFLVRCEEGSFLVPFSQRITGWSHQTRWCSRYFPYIFPYISRWTIQNISPGSWSGFSPSDWRPDLGDSRTASGDYKRFFFCWFYVDFTWILEGFIYWDFTWFYGI